MLKNETDIIKINFFKYLSDLGVSTKTHKNYRSDLNYFFNWVKADLKTIGKEVKELSDCIPFLGSETTTRYKNFLTKNSISSKTINRRLSTLRHLSRFFVTNQILDTDFASGIENIAFKKHETEVVKEKTFQFSHLATEFQGYLESKQTSKNTVKNYVSDVKHFLTWLETNHQILDSKQ